MSLLAENIFLKLWPMWYVRYAAQSSRSDEIQSCHIFLTWKVTLLMLIILCALSWHFVFAENSVQTLLYAILIGSLWQYGVIFM